MYTSIISHIRALDCMCYRDQSFSHGDNHTCGIRKKCAPRKILIMSHDDTGRCNEAPRRGQVSRAKSHHSPKNSLIFIHHYWNEHVSIWPLFNSSGISVSSLDESHIGLVCQTWKFGRNEGALRMIQNMVANFPSCCVLDADGKPVSWILTYTSCAIGMLYTQPEHRGKGYAKVVVNSIARRNHALGYPVHCFIEEENTLSYRLFKSMGFTEDPSYRATWFGFNHL